GNWVITTRRCSRSAPYFEGDKRTDCIIVVIISRAQEFRKPFFEEVVRFQHEADTNIAGLSYAYNVGAVDHCSLDSLPTEIEVCSDSDPPIEPFPGCSPISGRNRHLLGSSLCIAAWVESRPGSGHLTVHHFRIHRIALDRRC